MKSKSWSLKLILAYTFFMNLMLTQTQAAKILAVFPFPGPSQFMVVKHYLQELAQRGHDLTVVSAFPRKKPLDNYRDISVAEILRLSDGFVSTLTKPASSHWSELQEISHVCTTVTQNFFNNTDVQELLATKQHFDLIIMETFLNEALYGLSENFGGAPLVGVGTFGSISYIDAVVGNPSPASYIPHVSLPFTDHMTFKQRLENIRLQILEYIQYHLLHLPKQQRLYEKYFPHAKIALSEVRKNFSLVLLNQHFSLSFPRPYLPNVIEIGGLQVPPNLGKLPEHMQQFLDAADEGVIYFSLGSNVKSKDLPVIKQEMLLRVFGSLKQRVMWKFEDSNLPNMPENVLVSHWFPQFDILAHPNLKLFISHCGLLSTTEAIYYGKPVLAIPVFYDQFLNAKRAEAAGFSLIVNFFDLQEEELKSKLHELLENPKYKENAESMSAKYHDQPMNALEKAIYWTEYVLRYNGASHMRCASQDLNFFQYHSVDTLLTIFTTLFLGIALFVASLYCTYITRKSFGL